MISEIAEIEGQLRRNAKDWGKVLW